MTSTVAPTPDTRPRRRTTSRVARRFGYTVAAGLNVLMLWVVHRLLDWGWPGFLTEDLDRVLPLLSASLVVSILINVGYIGYDGVRFRALGDVVTGALGLAVTLRTWEVFPFDFATYARDWSGELRIVLLLGIVGTVIGIIAGIVKLIRGTPARA